MPLHENLERKRRLNIAELKKSAACHLCKCTGTRSIGRFIGNDEGEDGGAARDETQTHDHDGASTMSAINPPSNLPMRTCMCHGNCNWPYPLKVCEMCVADDATTGRIRSCGICGVVACDENCGVELVECTDDNELFNAGCLECRGMESFSEMELFRRRPHPNGVARATRVCKDCLELFSLFSLGSKYHFKCPKFKCNNLLVPSDIVELKRNMKPFPLSLLPEELLDSIVGFLGGKDLCSVGMVSTSMFRKVEKVSESIVTRFNHQLPTGPTHIVTADKSHSRKMTVYADGKNRQSLCPPEDGKTWVGILNQMEYLTRDIFYFDFQIEKDDGAAMRYLRRGDKLVFDRVFCKPPGAGAITPYFDTSSFSMRGGQVLVTKYKWHHTDLLEGLGDRHLIRNNTRSIIFSTDKTLDSGIHRVIIRYYCFCEGDSLGSIGLLRQQRDGSSVTWAHSHNIIYHGRMEEHVFGAEYNADARTLQMYKKNNKTNKMESGYSGAAVAIANEGGRLCFAVALSSHSIGVKGNQLSIRTCNEDEWSQFLDHTAEKHTITRMRSRGRWGEERLMRFLELRDRRNEIAGQDGQENIIAAHEHMMDRLMEDEMGAMNDSDSEEEGDMNLEDDAPNLAGVPALVMQGDAADLDV